MEQNKDLGVPSLSFLPARNFSMEVLKTINIIIPNEGTYESIIDDDDGKVLFKEEGAFKIFDGSSIDMPVITKVLFAMSKYPDLKDNELFVPLEIIFNVDDTININGSIVALC